MLAQPLSGATVTDEGAGTVGGRIYLIREALGTRRDPMPLDRVAELIERATGAVYDKSMLSRMETGERKVSLEDVANLASIDPLKRGRAWLAFGDDPTREAPPKAPPPVVQQERPGDSLDVSGYATPKRHRRRSNGEAG